MSYMKMKLRKRLYAEARQALMHKGLEKAIRLMVKPTIMQNCSMREAAISCLEENGFEILEGGIGRGMRGYLVVGREGINEDGESESLAE